VHGIFGPAKPAEVPAPAGATVSTRSEGGP